MFLDTLKSWPLFFTRETSAHWLATEAREGPNNSRQSRASHGDDWPPLRGRDGHPSFTWYCSQGGWQIIQHPLGFPTALEEMRVEFLQSNLSSAVTWTLSGILNSSVQPLSSPSVSPQTVPQLTRVTAGGTVMFELESLVIQQFRFSSRLHFVAYHR